MPTIDGEWFGFGQEPTDRTYIVETVTREKQPGFSSSAAYKGSRSQIHTITSNWAEAVDIADALNRHASPGFYAEARRATTDDKIMRRDYPGGTLRYLREDEI